MTAGTRNSTSGVGVGRNLFTKTDTDAGGVAPANNVSNDIFRQAGLGIDHAESDARYTTAGGMTYAADDFICVRRAGGSTRPGVTSYPDRLIVRPNPDGAAHRYAIASIVGIPQFRYTVPDHDRNWRGKILQRIVDYLHKDGD